MAKHQEQLNYIVIVSDTFRRDHLGCYGNEWIHTEHIDRFANKSLVFDKAYSASFPTVPTRRDIFTGNYTCTYTPWAPLDPLEPVLQVILKEKGYKSMMILDQHHILENGFHYDRGFDGFEWIRGQEGDRYRTWPDKPEYRSDPKKIRSADRLQRCHMRVRASWDFEEDTFPGRTGSSVCKWLEKSYQDTPFYLYVDFFDPHEPWDAPQWYVDMYDPDYEGDEVGYPRYDKVDGFLSEEELKHSQALYAAEVTLVDRWVGRIFQKIEDLGLMENTVVIFTTDHGFLLGEHGFIGKAYMRKGEKNQNVISYLPLFEEINHIPFIVHYPEPLGGRVGRTDAMVQIPDIFSTILDISGMSDLGAHGESFKDVLLGNTDKGREFALSFPYLKGEAKPISFVKDDYTAIFYSQVEKSRKGNDKTENEKKIDKAVDGVEKVFLPWEGTRDMLFNVKKDPQQENNILNENQELMNEFRSTMINYLEDLGVEDDIIEGFEK